MYLLSFITFANLLPFLKNKNYKKMRLSCLWISMNEKFNKSGSAVRQNIFKKFREEKNFEHKSKNYSEQISCLESQVSIQ